MTHAPILQPVVVLLGWTLVMMVWMMATRLPAMRKSGIDLGKLRGTKAADADLALPPAIQWKAHNYNHLMEQPTLFYAVALVLAMIGQGDGFNLILAWLYVAFRILHSIVQAVWNKVSVRFLFFALSSVALVGLVLHAGMALFL
ncbi:MAPEG family protein [Sphingomonas aestuarii]